MIKKNMLKEYLRYILPTMLTFTLASVYSIVDGMFVGHAVGGVCPFAVNEGVGVYLDVSLKRFRTVFPACGSSNSAIELTPEELAEYASGFMGWADVCKLAEN